MTDLERLIEPHARTNQLAGQPKAENTPIHPPKCKAFLDVARSGYVIIAIAKV